MDDKITALEQDILIYINKALNYYNIVILTLKNEIIDIISRLEAKQ